MESRKIGFDEQYNTLQSAYFYIPFKILYTIIIVLFILNIFESQISQVIGMSIKGSIQWISILCVFKLIYQIGHYLGAKDYYELGYMDGGKDVLGISKKEEIEMAQNDTNIDDVIDGAVKNDYVKNLEKPIS